MNKYPRTKPDFWDTIDGLIPLGIVLFVLLAGYAAHRNAFKNPPPATHATPR